MTMVVLASAPKNEDSNGSKTKAKKNRTIIQSPESLDVNGNKNKPTNPNTISPNTILPRRDAIGMNNVSRPVVESSLACNAAM